MDRRITDTNEVDLLVNIEVTRKEHEGLVTTLTWFEKKQRDAVIDLRQQQRLIPQDPHTNLILADGTTLSCFVIDVSPSGVAVSADIEPEIGTRLAVGRTVGHVVRLFNEGFAVQFDRLLEMDYLEHMIRPPQDLPAYLTRPPSTPLPPSASGRAPVSGLIGHAASLPEESVWLLD